MKIKLRQEDTVERRKKSKSIKMIEQKSLILRALAPQAVCSKAEGP